MQALLSREGVDGWVSQSAWVSQQHETVGVCSYDHEAWSEIWIDAQFESSDTLSEAMLADLARALESPGLTVATQADRRLYEGRRRVGVRPIVVAASPPERSGQVAASEVPRLRGGARRQTLLRRVGAVALGHRFRITLCLLGVATAPLIVLSVVRDGGVKVLDTAAVLTVLVAWSCVVSGFVAGNGDPGTGWAQDPALIEIDTVTGTGTLTC